MFGNKSEKFGKFPLENPLQKSATCVPLPINLFGPVAFQYPVRNVREGERIRFLLILSRSDVMQGSKQRETRTNKEQLDFS